MEIGYQEAAKLQGDLVKRLKYIAENNPRGVNKLATKYGYPCPKENVVSKFNFLTLFLHENGDDESAIDELVIAHPDFNLFTETIARKIGHSKPKLSRRDGPLKYQEEEEDAFIDVDQFDEYDGFIDNHDTYESDAFIADIAKAVGDTAKSVGKFAGTGKKGREANQRLAEEQTRQTQAQAQAALIQSRAAEKTAAKEQKAKTKRLIIMSSVAVVVIIILVLLYVFVIRKKK